MALTGMYSKISILIMFIGSIACQRMDVNVTGTGVCKGDLYRNVTELKQSLKECVVIIGSLEISLQRARNRDFHNTQFYNLREITEYLVIYRMRGLESVGQLFPNLTRIRGVKLFYNFGLIVHDNENLREIGLYSLLKIDRGGVIIWGLPQACFIDTVNWDILAPNARHVTRLPERQIECRIPCTCSDSTDRNYCWNNRKCQLFIEENDAEKCDDQCLGCRKTKKNACFTCRHYTHKFKCVSECPTDTILNPASKYCLTKEECYAADLVVWNNTCISECPVNYIVTVSNETGYHTCEFCEHCETNCSSLMIHSLSSIQNAERCVKVNGSLIIQLRSIPDIMLDLKSYLGRIQEVSDYISVEASDVILSLDFLSSLREIKGEKLKYGKYSLYISHNFNLKTLFSQNVTKNLIIKDGTAHFEHNPVLCMNLIDEIKARLPNPPDYLDIPIGSNGYSGGCEEVRFNFTIKTTSDTSVEIQFPIYNHNIYYSALYVRLLPGANSTVAPESCSEFEWHNTDVPIINGKNFSIVELKTLLPASIYAFCIEIYDPQKKNLSRSNIVNFTTPVGIPQPPFIYELIASKPDAIVIHWVDHRYYIKRIDYYELDVMLIERNSKETIVDYCKYTDDFFEVDYEQHALVIKPPPEYNKGCESICGMLSSVTPGALEEDYFDVCDEEHFACDNNHESIIMQNSTLGNYVRTLVLNINSSKTEYQVGGLAPFSDYKVRLRACAAGQCSRSTRGVVRTKKATNADFPSLTSIYANASGMISVKWKAPKISNGPILTYYIEVFPKLNISSLIPQIWCVPADKTETIVKSVIVYEYLVRVCLKTLASDKACSTWSTITVPSPPSAPNVILPNVTISKIDLLLIGIFFGAVICFASVIVGWIKKRIIVRSDLIPLVDNMTACTTESEPPALMLSDFVPFHTLSLE